MISIKELSSKTKDITVLYVEDEESVREQTLMIFDMLFDHIDTAFDGEDGWKKYQNFQYDIVFTDISMPRMDGLELTRHIKEKNPLQKVIIISAYNTADYLFDAIELGVDGFILKPIKMDKMVVSIQKLADAIIAIKFMQQYHNRLEQEVKEKTDVIKQQLVTDKLTGLQNRFSLNQTLDTLEDEKTLLLINIDNFDSINTIYGYENGNKVISSIANLLSKELVNGSELFYLGGDEFAIINNDTSKEVSKHHAQTLQLMISSLLIELGTNSLTCSVTIAISKGKQELLKNTHIALKEAKKEGKNRIKFYDDNLSVEILQQQIQEYTPIIKDAIKEDNVVPFFQPLVDNRTKKVYKYECLARIVTKDGTYSPFQFIDIAQMIGVLHNITKIMIDKSFKKFQNNDYYFSINITEIDLNDNYLYEYLSLKLQEYNMDSNRVILEVLEGISTSVVTNTLNQLTRLQELGFRIAIDDFGTQNSNFGRINSMKIDFIKIDGSFVKNIDHDEKSYLIVKAITEFSKSIGAQVIAEFVHNEAVQKKVEELGIEYSQGYYFSEPKQELFTL